MAIIAIDCDEVLVETMHTLCAYVKEVYNYDRDLEQFDSYHISENKHVGLDDNQVMKLFTDYYASEHAKSAGIPQGALDRLKAWKQAGHRLLVITARNDAWQQITDMQLERNFSGIFDDVIYAHHYTENHIPKSQLCINIGADYFIEDNMDNALDVALCDVKVFLINKPRNRKRVEDHPNIRRVNSWSEIEIP